VANFISVSKSDRIEISFTDWRLFVRELRQVDPKLLKKFRTKAVEIARPVETKIKAGIRPVPPITGMTPKTIPGRTTWGAVVPRDKTKVKADTRIRKQGKSIVSVWAYSPAVAIADQARVGGRGDGKLARGGKEYDYSRSRTGKRTHRVNGQGKGMVNALDKSHFVSRKSPSRIVWPAGEKAIPAVQARMLDFIEQESKVINATLLRIK
jgi:hypothetical protein